MTTPIADILRLADADANRPVAEIARELDLKPGRVYEVLREHRPGRPRKPRRRTSNVPHMVKGLTALGIKPRRIAFLIKVKPAYVYRILSED